MTRIAFASDLHIDSYFNRIDPVSGLNAREQDFLATTAWVGRRARELECEALIVAGDYTESKVPARGPRIARITRALLEGPKRQIHTRGNHDGEQAGDSIITVLGAMPGWSGYIRPGIERIGDLAVCVVPFLDRRFARTVPELAEIPDADLYRLLGEQYLTIARGLFVAATDAGAKAAVLVGHQQLAGGAMNDTQRAFLGDVDLVVDSRALSAIGYSACLFGHVHRGQTVIDDPACPVVFAGSLERVDFAEENEAKAFLVVDVADGHASIERVEVPARPYLTIRGSGTFNPAAVEDTIVRAIDLDPDVDTGELARALDAAGAFVVTQTRHKRIEAEASSVAIAEGLTHEAALEQYLADDPDRVALAALGREILTEVAG
jgi:exonuclease SbcD